MPTKTIRIAKRAELKIPAILLFIHGVLEVAGPTALLLDPQLVSSFEMGSTSLMIVGLIWGVMCFVAVCGIWRHRKWAIALGVVMSTITMTVALDAGPTSVLDAALSVPILMVLLHAWFGHEAPGQKEEQGC
ncbi:MAG: hypothetical protein PVH11_09995 [Anaerolineae bacterium]|jgi:uncharacterized membrane protein (DUF2068 family)